VKRLIAIAILALMSSLAFALPAPKDIEAAVNAGQLTRAEEMLKEVIREKPTSAKAHYELGQVLARAGRNFEAREALEKAKSLDPTLKFARDPAHFNEILNRIPGGNAGAGSGAGSVLAGPRAEVAVQSAPAPRVPAAPSFPWSYVLIGGGALLAAWMFMRRRASSVAGGPMMAGAGGSMAPAAGYGGGYGGAYPAAQPAPGGGIGVGGAVLGGVAGLAAGYGLAKMMEHGTDGSSHGSNLAGGSGYTPIEPASQPDYGSFDSGAGDNWDASDAGSGSDDDSW
jgi:hypothetical protein